MTIQKICVDIVKNIDSKYNIDRNSQLSFSQLMEEIGELAKEINKPKLRGTQIDMANLNHEFADVMLQLAILADIHGVDIEQAILDKIKILNERHNL
jgi:NTP pyrophosphatase (non-canonical NTP hydrolase)